MPKATKKSFRQNAVVAPKSETTTTTTMTTESKDGPTTHLSRGQRKRQAKRDQYLKREKLILSTLKLQKEEDQKKRIDGMDAIRKALKATMTKSTTSDLPRDDNGDRVETNKAKQQVAAKEVTHMNLVLQHPAFQSNPFDTIKQHLKNTLADQAEEQQVKSELRTKQEAEDAAKRKEAKKERVGVKHRKKFHATRRTNRR
mmetsp:Transcript_17855/g.27590  ORF Transcript_17855/g.27590 Transcript_17855/m.27590 type:complete len:200 (-) Transcript_17855:358-957(-)